MYHTYPMLITQCAMINYNLHTFGNSTVANIFYAKTMATDSLPGDLQIPANRLL